MAGPRNRLTPVIIAAVIAFDQASKALINELLPVHASVTIVPGVLNLTHVRNTGAAFGLLNAADFPFKSAIMTTIAAAALVAIAVYATRSMSQGRLARIALAMVIGGAIGNLIDRITSGHVVDFVDVYWRDYHFWAFNLADSAITVGATLLVLDLLALRTHVSEAV